MFKKKILLITLLTCILLILVSCNVNPVADVPYFEFDYQDQERYTIITEHAKQIDYRLGVPVKINDTYSLTMNGYDNITIKIDSDTLNKHIAFELGDKGATKADYLYTAYYCKEDLEYIIIHAWERKTWDGQARYKFHQGSAVVFFDDLSVVSFAAGDLPIVLQNNNIYYFNTLSIYSVPVDKSSDSKILYTLPFKKRIPNYSDSDNAPKPNIDHYIFAITDEGIDFYGIDPYGEDTRYELANIPFE